MVVVDEEDCTSKIIRLNPDFILCQGACFLEGCSIFLFVGKSRINKFDNA